MQSSHIIGFAVGIALYWLSQIRSGPPAAPAAGRYLEVGIVALLALLLRGGVLSLLTLRWHWAPQIAILFAVASGLLVTSCGYWYARSQQQDRSRSPAFAYIIVAYAILLRLIYAGSVELLPEETYYWNYSRHLDFGYLDHPPMVAWLIRLGTAVFGQTEFGVRAGALCCGAVTSVFVYKLTRNLFGEASALAALVLAQALPFFFLAGMLMTPDAPLTAAWAASLYFLERALIGDQRQAWWRAGICLGLGFISKYSIGLLVPVTVVFMLWDPQSRRWWRRPEPYVAALLALAVFSPVIIWNAQHQWISFAFQTSRRLAEAPRFALHKLIASIIVLLTPTGALAIAVALARPGHDASDDPGAARRRRFMGLAILIPLAVFAIFSLRHEVKLDWTGAPWTAALPVMGAALALAKSKTNGIGAWLRVAWPPTIVAMLLIYATGFYYLVFGLPGLGYGKHMELVPVGWRDLGRQIVTSASSYRQNNGVDVLIVGMDRYAIASEVAFYGAEHQRAPVLTMNSHLFEGMSLMYGMWIPPASQEHRTLLLVAFDPNELSGKSLDSHVASLGPIEDHELMRNNRVIHHYYQRLAYDYRSAPVE